MKRLAYVGGFTFASFLASPFASAQTPNPDNVYVLQASSRQATTTAPLTLTCSEPFKQGKKTVLRQTAVAIPAGDVIDSLTTGVRSQKFANVSTSEFLFVLDVRSKSVSARASDPVVLGLASGAVVAVPPSCVHGAATTWLRANLANETRAAASSASVSEPNKSDAASRSDQSPVTDSSLEFDTKGVDFSSWLRRFIAQVRRHWLIPERVMNAKDRVVVTFRVHKDGAIIDIALAKPSSVEEFNTCVLLAVRASNPRRTDAT